MRSSFRWREVTSYLSRAHLYPRVEVVSHRYSSHPKRHPAATQTTSAGTMGGKGMLPHANDLHVRMERLNLVVICNESGLSEGLGS